MGKAIDFVEKAITLFPIFYESLSEINNFPTTLQTEKSKTKI